MSRSVRDAIVSLSLANLCFLSVWLILLNPNHYGYYTWEQYPGFVEFTSLALLIVSLATLFFLLALLRLQHPAIRQIARVGFLLTILWPLNSFLLDYAKIGLLTTVLTGSRWLAALSLIAGLTTLLLVGRFFKQAVKVAITALLILSPLFVVNFASAFWMRSKYSNRPEHFESKHPASLVPTRLAGPRIVWIVFDELEWGATFGNRPTGIQLPEFDRLRVQTLFAKNAYPPGSETLVSMPALFTGQLLEDVKPAQANELTLKMSNGKTSVWSVEDDVFMGARRAGFSTGLTGWYHPYCRVIGDRLDQCSWSPIFDDTNPLVDKSLSSYVWLWARTAAVRIPLIFRLYRDRFDEQYEINYRRLHRLAFELVEQHSELLLRTDLNLKFLHYPVPHRPGIYDVTAGSLTTDPKSTYVENLVLADKTLGKIRELLEASGSWGNSIVLVTSDHWWRESPLINGKHDHRIPFMLKLAGQKAGVEYEHAFNTILTRELLLKLLQGELNSPTEVVTWIDGNSHLDESPVTRNAP